MVNARALSLAVFLVGAAAVLGAQDVAPQLSGRLDSLWAWTDTAGGQSTGLVTGWAGLVAGTKDVKSEVRLGVTNLPAPAVDVSRAWVKFRVPGVRVTTGLGRVGWGPGLVLLPGDLLFDSVGTSVNFTADELRTAGAWLADAWVSLGEEAFFEAAALKDVAGGRISAAPFGVTLEAAASWDRVAGQAKAAVSTQFHLGIDWYATVREDLSSGGGAFGLWDLGEGFSLTSRHEAWTADPRTLARWKSYHDLILASDAGWSFGGRALVSGAPAAWTPSVEAKWSPLQNLSLYTTVLPVEPRGISVGCSARW